MPDIPTTGSPSRSSYRRPKRSAWIIRILVTAAAFFAGLGYTILRDAAADFSRYQGIAGAGALVSILLLTAFGCLYLAKLTGESPLRLDS